MAILSDQFKREVPTQPGFYLIRSDGQPDTGIVFVTDEGKVQTFGDTHESDPAKLIDLPLAPYYFGPRLDTSEEEPFIKALPW